MENETDSQREDFLFSFVFQGRDDEYMGNSRYRMEVTINYLSHVVHEMGIQDKSEIIVVDYGSKRALHTLLNLSEESRFVTRFILIDRRMTALIEEKTGSTFHIDLAVNVGARRSRGRIALYGPADTIIPRATLEAVREFYFDAMASRPEHRGISLALARMGIPIEFVETEPNPEEISHYLESGAIVQLGPVFDYEFGNSGTVIVPRDMWWEIEGYDERLTVWGWADIEFGMRIMPNYRWTVLGKNEGIYVYHLEHYSIGKGDKYAFEKMKIRKNPELIRKRIVPANPDWGLGSIDFDEFANGTLRKGSFETQFAKDREELGRRFEEWARICAKGWEKQSEIMAAEQLYQNGSIIRALNVVENILGNPERQPVEVARLNYLAGIVLARLGRYEESLFFLSEALFENPLFPEPARLHREISVLRSGDPMGADENPEFKGLQRLMKSRSIPIHPHSLLRFNALCSLADRNPHREIVLVGPHDPATCFLATYSLARFADPGLVVYSLDLTLQAGITGLLADLGIRTVQPLQTPGDFPEGALILAAGFDIARTMGSSREGLDLHIVSDNPPSPSIDSGCQPVEPGIWKLSP